MSVDRDDSGSSPASDSDAHVRDMVAPRAYGSRDGNVAADAAAFTHSAPLAGNKRAPPVRAPAKGLTARLLGSRAPVVSMRDPAAVRAEVARTEQLIRVAGPPFARDSRFWWSTLLALVQGMAMGLVALAFFNIFKQFEKQTWNTDAYQAAIDAGPGAALGSGSWWWVGLSAGGGAVVGLMQVLWTVFVAEFPLKRPPLVTEVKDLSVHMPVNSICIIAVSAVSLCAGASIGPEAALGAVGASIGSLITSSHAAKYLACVQRWHSERTKHLFALTGIAAAFGPLLPSPILATLLLHELSIAGDAGEAVTQFHFMETVVYTGVAASASYALFTGLEDMTFLKRVTIPFPADVVIGDSWSRYVLYAIPLGVLCGVSGLLAVVLLTLGKQAGMRLRRSLKVLGLCMCRRSVGRHMGMLLTPVVGGTLFGLLAVLCPLTLGDGNAQLGAVVKASYVRTDVSVSAGTLIVTAVAKMAALSISLGFGFVGGQIFPLMFAGSCIGVAAHLLIPSIPVLVAVPCCLVAVPCSFTPVLFTLVSTAAMQASLGGVATGPVFVACFTSFATVCGLGLTQSMMRRRLAKVSAVAAAAEQARSRARQGGGHTVDVDDADDDDM